MAGAFLKNLLRKNPTQGFPPAVATELLYDFRSRTLCGVRLEAPLDGLTPFGVANAAKWLTDDCVRLDYHAFGLRVEVFEQVVEEFALFFEPALDHLTAFQHATCVLQSPSGASLRISRATTSSEIQRLLGSPDDTAPLMGRPTLEYNCAGSTHALFEFEPTAATLISATFASGLGQPVRSPTPAPASADAPGDGRALSPSAARRLGVLVGVYLAVLILAAAFGAWDPKRAEDAAMLSSLVASFSLGFFGLGGNAIFEERMRSRWWFLIPKLEFVPFMLCFLLGLGLVSAFRAIFEGLFGG